MEFKDREYDTLKVLLRNRGVCHVEMLTFTESLAEILDIGGERGVKSRCGFLGVTRTEDIDSGIFNKDVKT